MKNLIYILFFLISFSIFSQEKWHENQRTYEYDNLNRLVKVVFNNGTVYEYSYDKLGNRITKKASINTNEIEFEITHNNLVECIKGKLAVTANSSFNYVIHLRNIENNEVKEYQFTKSLDIKDLELGKYTFCITLKNDPSPNSRFEYCHPETITITDYSYIGDINNDTFSFDINHIEGCRLGNIYITPRTRIACHDYFISIRNEVGLEIFSGILIDNLNIENLEIGKYTTQVYLENFPETTYDFDFEIEDNPRIKRINISNFDILTFNAEGCEKGRVEIYPRETIECHDYYVSVKNFESDDELYFGKLSDYNLQNKLEVGDYSFTISMENVDREKFEVILNANIKDNTSVNSINENDFHLGIENVYECRKGSIRIAPLEFIDCHTYQLKVKDQLNNVIYSGRLSETLSLENLELGNYRCEVTLDYIMPEPIRFEFDILDNTSSDLINSDNFNLDIINVDGCDLGSVSITPIEYIDCHDYHITVRNFLNEIIFSDMMLNTIHLDNLDVGNYTFEIFAVGLSNIPKQFNFKVEDATDLSFLDTSSFNIEKVDVQGCNQDGVIQITPLELIPCHSFYLKINDLNGNIITSSILQNEFILGNLDVGVYTIEINLNEFVYVKEVFISDSNLESSNNFSTEVYGNFESSNGTIKVEVNQFSDCRNHTLSITNQWGSNIHSGTFSLDRRIQGLDKGTYTICIGLEYIPSEYFEHCYSITITDDKKLVNGYIDCLNNLPEIHLNLPQNSNKYYVKALNENSSLIWEGNTNGYRRIDNANKYEYVTVSVYAPDYLNGDIVSYNLFIDDIPRFETYLELFRNDNQVSLSSYGGIPPYNIEIFNPDFGNFIDKKIEEEFTNEIFDLYNGVNYIRINHSEHCDDEFFEKVILYDDYKLFPNPTSDEAFVFFPKNLNPNMITLKLFDTSGKLVYQKQGNHHSNEIKLNISHLSNAVYILRLFEYHKPLSWSEKLIKK